MTYEHINPNEDAKTTAAILDMEYVPPDLQEEVNAADCRIYKRGKHWVVEHEGKVLLYEYHTEAYPYFEKAIRLMKIEVKEEWKTVKNLRAFRQAIREDTLNMRGLQNMLEGKTLDKNLFEDFMTLSRGADLAHHGELTF